MKAGTLGEVPRTVSGRVGIGPKVQQTPPWAPKVGSGRAADVWTTDPSETGHRGQNWELARSSPFCPPSFPGTHIPSSSAADGGPRLGRRCQRRRVRSMPGPPNRDVSSPSLPRHSKSGQLYTQLRMIQDIRVLGPQGFRTGVRSSKHGLISRNGARRHGDRGKKLTIGLEPITCCLQGSCSTN